MTLGGLALAVGILVDDATVTIENINRHLEEGHERRIRHPRRLASDPRARTGLDTGDLHRVRADVPAVGRCAVPVRSDGRSRRVRDARPRTCCRAHSCRRLRSTGCARRSRRRPRPRSARQVAAVPGTLRSADSPHFASAITRTLDSALRHRRPLIGVFRGAVAASMLLIPLARPQFLSGRRLGPDQAPHARTLGHPRGADGGAGRPDRGGAAQGDSSARARQAWSTTSACPFRAST